MKNMCKEKEEFLKPYKGNYFNAIKLTHYNKKYVYSQYIPDQNSNLNSSELIDEKNIQISASSMISAPVIDLPDLDLPENDLTLNKLINFFNDSKKYTRILPIYISIYIKNNDKDKIEKAENWFSLLLNVYKTFKPYENSPKDFSFLSEYLDEYLDLFEKMISKLKKADFRIDGFDYIKKEENSNEILRLPEYETLENKETQYIWNRIEKLNRNELNIYYSRYHNKNNNYSNNNKNYEEDNDDINDNEDNLNDTKKTNINSSQTQNIHKNDTKNTQNKILNSNLNQKLNLNNNQGNNGQVDNYEFNSYGQTDSNTFVKIKFGNNTIIDNTTISRIEENQEQGKDIPIMELKSEATTTQTVNPEPFGNKNFLFNEKEGIKRCMNRIEKINENEKFNYEYKHLSNYYPKNIESLKSDLITIKEMIDNSRYISKIFLENFYEKDIPFLNEGVSILIDCSGYINKDSKLFNMFLICGLTEGLNAIGMKYSVALISDENFKRIIKDYDTPHSEYELQKIYECYMINRYRTNLAKSLHFAIDNLKYDSGITGITNINSNTAFFIFTDGMDENLFFGKDFKTLLFNDPNISFGFVFIKSSSLTKDEDDKLEIFWNKFIEETNGSLSKVQIEKAQSEYDPKKIKSIIKMFTNILSRSIDQQNYELGKIQPQKAIFEIPNNEDLETDSLEFIEDSLLDDLSSHKDIFYNISQIHFNNKLKHEILDINYYNNKTGKIMNCRVPNSIKEEYNKLINNFIIPKNKINIPLLDQIFFPNKPSTMVLSTTGSEIDIPAFIKYLFENNPNPMIYLEKKGGFTKHYSLSIIIDSSYSI